MFTTNFCLQIIWSGSTKRFPTIVPIGWWCIRYTWNDFQGIYSLPSNKSLQSLNFSLQRVTPIRTIRNNNIAFVNHHTYLWGTCWGSYSITTKAVYNLNTCYFCLRDPFLFTEPPSQNWFQLVSVRRPSSIVCYLAGCTRVTSINLTKRQLLISVYN